MARCFYYKNESAFLVLFVYFFNRLILYLTDSKIYYFKMKNHNIIHLNTQKVFMQSKTSKFVAIKFIS